MTWMNLTDRRYYIIPILITLFLSVGTSKIVAQQTHFDQLINRFKQGSVFHAAFNHQYIDSYTGDTVATSGMIWVGENKYKVQNNNQTVVVDGELSRVYDKNRDRVIVSTYEPEEDDFAPSRFLNGADTTYTVQNQQQQGNETLIKLSSGDPFSVFQRVEITLGAGLIPQEIFALDQADNHITTFFNSGKFIEPQQDLFELSYPDGAEVIDMRSK